jgi:hypothetical protein
MKVRQYQPAFVRGELSPNMVARRDVESYGKGLALLRNAYVATQGGCYKREGTKEVAPVPAKGRLVSFAFNTDQEYILVFTPGQFAVYKDDVPQVTVSSAPVNGLTAGQIAEMVTLQSADTLFLFHRDVEPIRITRTGHTVWTASLIPLTNIPTYDFGSGAEAVISATRGWPRCGVFYEGRLWMGGLKSRPQTLLASQVGDFFNFAQGTGLDNEAINVTIDDDRVNAILNLFAGRTLFIMTTGGEFGVQGQLGDPVTPGKIAQQLNKLSLHGSSPVTPISVDGSVIFVERSGLVIRQLTFDFYENSYTAKEISSFSPHLIRQPVRMDTRSATIKLSANFTYLVNSDGTVAVLNVVKDQNLLAWSLFETDGLYEDVAVLNGTEVYFIVKRTINGATVRYLEKLDPTYNVDAGIKKTRATLANGDFANGLTGWTVTTTGAATATVINQQLQLAIPAPGQQARVEQSVLLDAVPYTLLLDVDSDGSGLVEVRIGTASGLQDIARLDVRRGQENVLAFTPSAGTVFISLTANVTTQRVDNVKLLASRWTGLGILEGRSVKAIINGGVAEDATITGGILNASIAGDTLECGLMFYPILETLPPVVSDQQGNNLVGQYSRLVGINMDLLDTQEVVVKANNQRYKPTFRRFNTDKINQPIQPYTGWKECHLGGFARDSQVTITQDNPVGWNVLAVNVAIGV